MLFVQWPQAQHITQAQTSEKSAPSTAQQEEPKAFWQKVTADPVATFTLCLVVVAAVQAAFFVVQLSYMRTGMEDATLAAEAAQASAETAQQQVEITKLGVFDLNRAYLDVTPSDIETRFIADHPPATPAVFRPGDPKEIFAKITLKNSGKTRAVVIQIYGEFRTGDWLPPIPQYDTSKGQTYPTDMSIADGEVLPLPWGFTTSEVVEQFFVGYVLYRDIFSRGHISRFGMRIFPSIEPGGDARQQLVANEAWRESD